MKRRLLSFMLVAMIIICGTSVYAAEGKQQETIFTVTPRVWFVYGDLADKEWFDSDAIFLPMYGLSVSVTPGQMPNWSFLLNGYHGTSDGNNIVTTQPNQPHYSGTSDYERSDIEFLIRYTFPDTGLGLFIGPRYISWKRKQSVPSSNNFVNQTEAYSWIPQIGVSYVSEIGESGNHRVFSNLSVGVSKTSWESRMTVKVGPVVISEKLSGGDTQPCIDGNLGYEYFFTKFGSATLRYRFSIFREEAGPGQQRFTSFHGPEIGLSFRF